MASRDDSLERLICKAALELQTAKTSAARRSAFARLQQLHRHRTSGQVARMEAEKGLR